VRVRILGRDVNGLRLCWCVEGTETLILPAPAEAERASDLWRTTCFEVFARSVVQASGGECYTEMNFSPSGKWNVFDFQAYRAGMTMRPMTLAPSIARPAVTHLPSRVLEFDVIVPIEALPTLPARLNLTAVLEEQGGMTSYWAPLHPSPEAPDFHLAAGFTELLAA
jgi:hypothetical protein